MNKMLLKGSILPKICILLVIYSVNCEEYYSEDDHADISEDSGEHHPDYSKYYSVDNPAPLLAQPNQETNFGFVNPNEFANFFGPSPIAFGASNNQEVLKQNAVFTPQNKQVNSYVAPQQNSPELYSSYFPRDFFEESQQKQTKSQSTEDSPNYISHNIPAKLLLDNENKKSFEIERIKPQVKSRNEKNQQRDELVNDESSENYKEDDDRYSSEEADKPQNYNEKYTSTGPQYPKAQGFYGNYDEPASTLSPYQKYSFQPVTDSPRPKYLESLISTAAPFNPAYNKQLQSSQTASVYESQPTENVPKNLKGCKKIKKPVSGKDSVNCFVCEDPGNKSKYTQCSYSTEPDPVNYYEGKSERYSTPARGGDGFRYKRYSGNENDETDPYEYVKQKSLKLSDAHDKQTPDFSELFQYSPDFESDSSEKSFSEAESEELKKNPQNCKKVAKDGMTCTVCKNEKTGGNFEQCSYTSEPKEKKYAYVTNKKYNSNDDQPEEEETKTVELKSKKTLASEKPKLEFGKKTASSNIEPIRDYEGRINPKARPERNDRFSSRRKEETRHNLRDDTLSKFESSPRNSKFRKDNNKASSVAEPTNDSPYSIPQHFVESTEKQERLGGDIDSELYGGEEKSENKEEEKSDSFKDFDDYHYKFFPENKEESRQEEQQAEYTPANTKHNVEEVLAEFSKKDRSNCKKAEKKGMICYLCVDKNKIQHEECMYISEPQKSHLAYHEVQQLKKPEVEDEGESESKQSTQRTPVPTTVPSKQKRFFKKVTTPTPVKLELSASEEVKSYVNFNPKKVRNNKKLVDSRVAASQQNYNQKSENEEPTIKTPAEFEVGEEEGAFSAETKPVYSKALGLTLPKYMVVKSEFEKEFDASSTF